MRHPVRIEVDGDFALPELVALSGSTIAHRITAELALERRLWRLPPAHGTERSGDEGSPQQNIGAAVDLDAALMHLFETGWLFRPPVNERVTALTVDLGQDWLALAAHWVGLSMESGDLRFLNTACKLTGAVWLRVRKEGGAWSQNLASQLAAVGRLLEDATSRLAYRLRNRILLDALVGEGSRPPKKWNGPARARIVVLASAGSRSVGRLVREAVACGLPITTVCVYAGRSPDAGNIASNYSGAWYPAGMSRPSTSVPDGVPVTEASSWDQVRRTIVEAGADLVLLVGMPVVPSGVLEVARLGFFNAHNGMLPAYRGMDAVGWAILDHHPIVCTLHLARLEVDAGEVVAVQPVPLTPTDTLANRVKSTQLRLLIAGALHVASTGGLPDSRPQAAIGRRYYRMHPHLKRLLDTSPYCGLVDGRDDN